MKFERSYVAQDRSDDLDGIDVDVYNQSDLEHAIQVQVCI